MKPVLPTIGTAALCMTCGTAVSALYFSLIALLCWFISSGFTASTNNSATWEHAALFGLILGVVPGLVCSSVFALTSCRSADLLAMRKKFASQLALVLLTGAVLAVATGIYGRWEGSHGGTFVTSLAARQGMHTQTALAYLVFCGATVGVMLGVVLLMTWASLVKHIGAPTLSDLILPFNVTKYLMIGAILIGTIWGLFLPSSGLLQSTYKLAFGSAMWGVATLYLSDFAVALAGGSSPFWQKFYADNKTDLFVCGITGLTLLLLLTLSSERYSWYSIDLALLGLPFFLYAIFAIHECATIKVAGRRLPLRIRMALCILFASLYAITILVLLSVQSKAMPEHEALWYQISIFCSGLSALIFSRQIVYMLKQNKIEPSPVLLAMFSSMKFSPGIYAEVTRAAQQWNQHVIREKAKLRKEKARASKGRRR